MSEKVLVTTEYGFFYSDNYYYKLNLQGVVQKPLNCRDFESVGENGNMTEEVAGIVKVFI